MTFWSTRIKCQVQRRVSREELFAEKSESFSQKARLKWENRKENFDFRQGKKDSFIYIYFFLFLYVSSFNESLREDESARPISSAPDREKSLDSALANYFLREIVIRKTDEREGNVKERRRGGGQDRIVWGVNNEVVLTTKRTKSS